MVQDLLKNKYLNIGRFVVEAAYIFLISYGVVVVDPDEPDDPDELELGDEPELSGVEVAELLGVGVDPEAPGFLGVVFDAVT